MIGRWLCCDGMEALCVGGWTYGRLGERWRLKNLARFEDGEMRVCVSIYM